MSEKKPFAKEALAKAKFSLSALSIRRKAGLVVLLLLIGAGIADPGFVGDADADAEFAGAERDEFNDIDSLLSTFDEDKTLPAPLESPPQTESFEPADSATFLTMDDPYGLTIPPAPANERLQVREASHSSKPAADSHARSVAEVSSTSKAKRSTAGVSIRLSGTIYPIH